MLLFPNAKINIGLHILSKLDNGFHTIDSCFYPIKWCDILEYVEGNEASITQTGINLDNAPENNIVWKAYQLLQNDFPKQVPSLKIHLEKIIPVGAGLGGGSADASFMLQSINSIYQLGLDNISLKSYAQQIGSDCPFFIDNTPKIVNGTGELMSDINLPLEGKQVLLIYPNTFISTKEAYQNIKVNNKREALSELLKAPITEWKDSVKNDFEESLASKYTFISDIKNWFYDNGALYSSLSGSGSTIYGIFDNDSVLPTNIPFKGKYKRAVL